MPDEPEMTPEEARAALGYPPARLHPANLPTPEMLADAGLDPPPAVRRAVERYAAEMLVPWAEGLADHIPTPPPPPGRSS